MVVKRHSFVTGGISVMEHFRKDYHLDGVRTQTNCESCCAYNMLKLAKELFKATGKKKSMPIIMRQLCGMRFWER